MVSTLNIVVDNGIEYLLTGGADKFINVYTITNGTLSTPKKFSCDSTPRSLDMMNGKILVGMSNGTIRQFNYANLQGEDLIRSHSSGEVWGLTMIDEENSKLYITSGDDNMLLLYDID
jgi:WD40 repeat protein